MRRSSCLLILLLVFPSPCGLVPVAFGALVQPILRPVPRPISPWFALDRHAGLIFAGQVLRVERVPVQHLRDLETVEIRFRVDEGIRGTRKGQILAIREWAGLWVAQPRYRVGEKVILFLYAPSRLGLTSPVGDLRGRFAVNSAGKVALSPAQQRLFTDGEFGPRWDKAAGIPVSEFLHQIRGAVGGRP
jgi:hypothetical protein